MQLIHRESLIDIVAERDAELLASRLSQIWLISSVNEKNDNGETALHVASGIGFVEGVRLLLEKGAWIDVRDKDGFTPLIVSALTGKDQCMSMLLENGADIELTTQFGLSAMKAAENGGHAKCVELLSRALEHNQSDEEGEWDGTDLKQKNRRRKNRRGAPSYFTWPYSSTVAVTGAMTLIALMLVLRSWA